MPCNSEHMNARPNEVLSRETARHIVYLNEKLGQETPAYIATAAKEYYGDENRVDEIVALLCTTIRGMTPEQVDTIVYNGKDAHARDLANWWDEHQKADAIREAAEAAAAEEAASITVKLSSDNQASIRRLVQNEVARLNSMLHGLSPEASDRARLQPEIDRLTALYAEVGS